MVNIKIKIAAIIPARSGSKSIKDKNIMSIGGKPLIAYSIEHAKKSKLINRIIVTTDSEYYAEISRQYGAETPFIRPEEIAGDESTDLEVFTHILNFLKEREGSMPDICVHLRPTCPIRNADDIDLMIKILLENEKIDSVRSLSEAPETPYKMWNLNENNLIKPLIECGIKEAYNLPRQKLPKVYIQNASVDVFRSATIIEKRSMTGENIYGYLMKDFYDIDTYEQFEKVSDAILSSESIPTGKTFCFDIDGVVATLTPGNDYAKALPITENIKIINKLFELKNKIYLNTARGFATGTDWTEITKEQLHDWGVSYTELFIEKPAADYYIDDRMISISEIKKLLNEVI